MTVYSPLMSHSHNVFSGYLFGPSVIVPCRSVNKVLPPHLASVIAIAKQVKAYNTKPNHLHKTAIVGRDKFVIFKFRLPLKSLTKK